MKEILYIQAGRVSNYTGTHFWNTQECYLQSDGNGVDPRISFCENIDGEGRSTMCPRVLIFDEKAQFGTLSTSNMLVQGNEGLQQNTWAGSTATHKHELIPRSDYHIRLDEEKGVGSDFDQGPGEIRYWSDYSRVYFLPRSLPTVPEIDWNWSQQEGIFSRFNEESELMDGALRLFVEDCDNIQGIQVMNDTNNLCGFINGFLTNFRDEYNKVPSIIFPLSTLRAQDHEALRDPKRFLTEALYLHSLNELSSMNIPVEDSSFWSDVISDEPLCWPGKTYHQSAVLSACIESATLPFRSRLLHEDMPTICNQLKFNNQTPFGMLNGTFPVLSTFSRRSIVNFSSSKPTDVYASIDITRGFSIQSIQEYERWSTQRTSSATYVKSIHTFAYPLPSSFPPFGGTITPPAVGSQVTCDESRETPMFSSIFTAGATSKRFEGYATFVDRCSKHESRTLDLMGFTLDDMRELSNDLWSIVDKFSADGDALAT